MSKKWQVLRIENIPKEKDYFKQTD